MLQSIPNSIPPRTHHSRSGDWPSLMGDLFNELRTRASMACRRMQSSSGEVVAASST